MLIRIALLLISVPLLVHGGEGLYLAARSRTQASMTCAEYFRQRPRSGWIRLTGCEVDYVRAGYREARGRITEMLFPLRPTGSTPALPAAVVLATRDRDVLAIAERTMAGTAQSDQESFLVMMLQIVTAMRVSREVDGVVRPPLETLRTRRSLEAIRAPLDEHFVIVDLHARPRLLLPAIETFAGAAALLVFLLRTSRARRGAAEPAPTDDTAAVASETAAATPAVNVPAAPLRGVMLLNLPPAATIADIETAPPLGSQSEVRDRLGSVLPGVSFDDAGRGSFSRPDVRVSLDLARLELVHTAVIDLEGEGAERTLRHVLSQTGWRAFSPRRWTFL
jgi:hypothetical protein